MKIKRLVTSINTESEGLGGKLENHQAIADLKIQEIKKGAVKVSMLLGVVRYRLDKLLRRDKELQISVERWRIKAIELNQLDHKKALHCVRAMNKSEDLQQQIRTQICQERQLEKEFEQYLSDIAIKLNQMQIRREALLAQKAKNNVYRLSLPEMFSECSECNFAPWDRQQLSQDSSQLNCSKPQESLGLQFPEKEEYEHLQNKLVKLCEDGRREG